MQIHTESGRKPRSSEGLAAARVFHAPTWSITIIVLGLLISIAGTWLSYRQSGLSLWFWISAAVLLFFLAGLADALVSRLVLDEDALHVIELLSRRSYPRAEILEVRSAKGCPIALRLATRGWVKLPMMIAVHPNTIRAWAKR